MAVLSRDEARTYRARKHATRTHTCVCGKVCRGNGGWSSHKRACPAWKAAVAARRTAEAAALAKADEARSTVRVP